MRRFLETNLQERGIKVVNSTFVLVQLYVLDVLKLCIIEKATVRGFAEGMGVKIRGVKYVYPDMNLFLLR